MAEFNCSLNNTAELRKLLLENPDLPLLIFCGEDSWHDRYPYEQAEARNGGVKELTQYKGWWMDKEDYKDNLSEDLYNLEEYKNLSEEEYDQMIKEKVAKEEYVKAIVLYVG